MEKKSVFSTVILVRSFLLVLGIFYILTYYLYQILGNATLLVKIHHKNTLSIITKQYFLSSNFHHYSLTEVSTSIKHTNRSCSGMGAGKAPLPKICHTYPTMMKLGTVIPYLKKIQKIYESRDTPLASADISIFSSEILKICCIKKYRYRLHFST